MREKRSIEPIEALTQDQSENSEGSLPNHIALIMDGNGRWAKKRGLERSEGHRAGINNIRPVLDCLVRHNIRYVTLYAFSTENWNRPAEEVNTLMNFISVALRKELEPLHEKGVRINHIGRSDGLTDNLKKEISRAVKLTNNNETLTLNVAFNYGGRAELIDAVRAMIHDQINPDKVTENIFENYLYTQGIPDPDLIVRTAGEMRLSNFLLWQSAYSEYYTTFTLWPEFDENEIKKALTAFNDRQRRYGNL